MAEEGKAASKDYNASCHCGKVRLTATISPPLEDGHEATTCNCSICSRMGYMLVYCKDKDLVWHQGKDALTGYEFGKKMVSHRFCPTCGTNIVGVMVVDSGPYAGTVAVNVRCIEGLDLDKVKTKFFDGKDKIPASP